MASGLGAVDVGDELEGIRSTITLKPTYRIPAAGYGRFIKRNLNVQNPELPPAALDSTLFPWPASDLKGQPVYLVEEVSAVLEITPKHVGQLIAEGELMAVNVRSEEASRSCFRVPVEAYRAFVLRRIVKPAASKLR